jgi:AcrR family transcriptional regulator
MAASTRAPRSDGTRNRDAVLDAAVRLLSDDSRASMADIAAAAGISRVTMYGHFSSRQELIEAVLVRTIDRSEAELAAVDLDGDALDALERLVKRSWRIVDTFHRLLGVAEEALTNERVMAHHTEPMARIGGLIERGQRDGTIRGDLDVAWLTTCFTAILHAAAGEVRAGRLDELDADRVVTASILSLMRPQVA